MQASFVIDLESGLTRDFSSQVGVMSLWLKFVESTERLQYTFVCQLSEQERCMHFCFCIVNSSLLKFKCTSSCSLKDFINVARRHEIRELRQFVKETFPTSVTLCSSKPTKTFFSRSHTLNLKRAMFVIVKKTIHTPFCSLTANESCPPKKEKAFWKVWLDNFQRQHWTTFPGKILPRKSHLGTTPPLDNSHFNDSQHRDLTLGQLPLGN